MRRCPSRQCRGAASQPATTVHGLVSLHLRGLHPTDAPAPATVVDVALRAVVAGWLAAPRHSRDGNRRTIEPTF